MKKYWILSSVFTCLLVAPIAAQNGNFETQIPSADQSASIFTPDEEELEVEGPARFIVPTSAASDVDADGDETDAAPKHIVTKVEPPKPIRADEPVWESIDEKSHISLV
ncbi:MAG: hypothetical protein ACRCUY_05710, partial [Thermoguttaceae bacterium]